MILMFAKKDRFSDDAVASARAAFGPALVVHRGVRADPFPIAEYHHKVDLVLSFLSPWIVPGWLLARAAQAINFHPGSHRYPGIGCYNFALYEGAPEYGCVCHHMAEKVDTGAIIAERLFATQGIDSVEALKLTTMETMVALFREIVAALAAGEPLPRASMTWARPPFTRKQLEALREISLDMPKEEVARRVRAVTYPGFPGAELRFHGISFLSEVPDRDPVA
jgi:methionyl-tRNA formyltransferase